MFLFYSFCLYKPIFEADVRLIQAWFKFVSANAAIYFTIRHNNQCLFSRKYSKLFTKINVLG